MNPKIPSKELELRKKKRWLKNPQEEDPWRGVTELLVQIEPAIEIPANYNFKALHDRVMDQIEETHPKWAQKKKN